MPPRRRVEIDGATGEVLKPPPKRKRAKLDTLQDVKREMAKIYREARSGLIDNQDATKQVWMLAAIGKVIVDYDIEKRIEALENLTQ
jgi:hypothetical protein